MSDYLFVWHPHSREYILRFQVGGHPTAGVAGVIDPSEAEELLLALRRQFPSPEYIVERMSGTSWEAVADNFPGLYLH